jgi:hypothetical protein
MGRHTTSLLWCGLDVAVVVAWDTSRSLLAGMSREDQPVDRMLSEYEVVVSDGAYLPER